MRKYFSHFCRQQNKRNLFRNRTEIFYFTIEKFLGYFEDHKMFCMSQQYIFANSVLSLSPFQEVRRTNTWIHFSPFDNSLKSYFIIIYKLWRVWSWTREKLSLPLSRISEWRILFGVVFGRWGTFWTGSLYAARLVFTNVRKAI